MLPAASSDPGPAATATLTNANNVQPTTKYTSAVFRLPASGAVLSPAAGNTPRSSGTTACRLRQAPTPVEVFSTSVLPGVTVPATPLPVGLPSFSFLNMGSVNTNRPCLCPLSRAIERGNLHSTGISPFIAKPVPVPLQGSRLNTSFYVVCSYSGNPLMAKKRTPIKKTVVRCRRM